MKSYFRLALWINILFFLVIFILITLAKTLGFSVGSLFSTPFSPLDVQMGILTHIFQLLCTVPPIVCAFTFTILNLMAPRRKENSFILVSAIVTGGFLFNTIFRFHIFLFRLGIPKPLTILIYVLFAGIYGFTFKEKIQSTPYRLLLIGIGLLFTGILVDSLHLSDYEFFVLLEGVLKLFSELNIALYFWGVCYKEIMQAFNAGSTKIELM
ncbi:MAG: hypothetical protein KME19_08025 [Microcoleus vaginatus WJT46-NPBG5]|jgi:hypothetical protein|nr:hypothetical protein [Microcoleus vaginatus WJT46-NPBG5]